MFTAAKRLTNLVWLVDYNKKQLDGYVKDILEPFDLEEKFRAFGFDACTVNGNDVGQIYDVLTKEPSAAPRAVILDTVKGKGVKEVEDIMFNHSMTVEQSVFDRWIQELRQQLEALG